MANNTNGFADMADYLGNLSKVDPKKISIESLEEAANFYLKQLLPNIPKSLLKKKHMNEQIKVVVENDQVKVQFEETAFYWRFAENGTTKQRAQHFASGTYEQNKEKIEEIMTRKILSLWRG
ncbi:HK97 gp10 family phage protein [Enterococcus durans]|uniref:HK97-gp10 family putative phage morphogenesis protein n=1 Tax=Enterococcus durans TaxID=53345 RepID=UPI000F4E79B5|nr:HK97-gp10 family putative phage morphogenesis protein [Enterococcus durans]QED60548.1 HK97 gp10 family phage protein [Enterococcus durans]QED63138.1 HK97 gp10 family phage protein [Enterococcus durans]ROX83678.1 HK97 gp10 family phage protein [Enterococcus durans]